MTAWLCDLDSLLGPRQNHYVYLHPKTQKFMFLPWDQDQTFGQFPRERPTNRDARISAFRSPLSPSFRNPHSAIPPHALRPGITEDSVSVYAPGSDHAARCELLRRRRRARPIAESASQLNEHGSGTATIWKLSKRALAPVASR